MQFEEQHTRPTLKAAACAVTTRGDYFTHSIRGSNIHVREPQGNGCAERFIRVLKENLLWIRRFATIEELRLVLLAFQQTYNQSWIIERRGYRTPAQVRTD